MDFRVSQVEISVEVFHEKVRKEEGTCGEKIAKNFCVPTILSGKICGEKKTETARSLLRDTAEKIALVKFSKANKKESQKTLRVNSFLLQILSKAFLFGGA